LDENLVTSTGVNLCLPVPLEVKSIALPAIASAKLIANLIEFEFEAMTK
jgi:hypothetical protein